MLDTRAARSKLTARVTSRDVVRQVCALSWDGGFVEGSLLSVSLKQTQLRTLSLIPEPTRSQESPAPARRCSHVLGGMILECLPRELRRLFVINDGRHLQIHERVPAREIPIEC